MKIKLQEIVGIYIRKASKIVHEWNGRLEVFSRPRVMEILGNIWFSKHIFYRKQSMGPPEQYFRSQLRQPQTILGWLIPFLV